MSGSVTITESKGQPITSTDVDFAMCIIGHSTSSAVTAGKVSPFYASPAAAVTDLGLGDAVDALTQALTLTPGNPAPHAVAFYTTPATTPGVRGTLTVSGVAGTSVVTRTASTHPTGTYQVVGKVILGGTVGTGPISIAYSFDGGRTYAPQLSLGTGVAQVPLIGSTDAGVGYDFAAGTLVTGDTWSESATTPPMFADADLYAAGPPALGAFAAIAESSLEFGVLVISEPVAAGDFATLVAGLNYGLGLGKRWTLIVRFRDPTSGETDAAYIVAANAFCAAHSDNRITVVAGSGWLTDAFRGYVYLRSGLPALLARLQSFIVVPGQIGERLAQSPGFVGNGALEGFSIVDSAGNLIGHDEAVRGGIDGPVGAVGGALTFYRVPNPDIVGTFVSEMPVMYPALSAILTMADRRVANGIERVASAVAWLSIQGADIFDPITLALDDDIRDAMSSKIASAVKARYSKEFQNADDPNIVTINPVVTVSGAAVTITGVINARLYGYTKTIQLTFSATR